MKITNLKTFVIPMSGHNVVLVKLETDEGLFGIGEASLAGRDRGVLGILEHFAPLLAGRDPSQIEDIWQELYRNTFWRGGPTLLSAISGIDIALWDLKGKRLGAPIYDLLGGRTRERVRVYTHLRGATDDELSEHAVASVEQGYTALRIAPSLFNAVPWDSRKSVRATISTLERLRTTVVDDVDLIVDVHHRFTPMENVHLARGVQDLDLLFIEDPLPPDNLQSYQLLRAKIDVPLATGEAMVTVGGAAMVQLLAGGLVDPLAADYLVRRRTCAPPSHPRGSNAK